MIQAARGAAASSPNSTLDVVTALATSAAALVAIVAVWVGWHIAKRERDLLRLGERQRALVELLASFEALRAVQEMRSRDRDGKVTTAEEQQLAEVRGRWRANLYASPEDLPYTREAAFSHFGAGRVPEGARLEGNPETDEPEIRAVRGELVDALDRLREQMRG